MDKIELFIFDMDGLLFDTGRLAYRAYYRSAEKHDFEITHNVYYYLTGRTEADIREEMAVLYGTDVDSSEWRRSMNEFKEEILAKEQRVFKKKGVREIFQFAQEQGVKIAVASSNSRDKVKAYLEMEGIQEDVDLMVTGDQVSKGKPDPEIFLTACKEAGIAPDHAVVFEDSAAGIEAASRAGIRSFLIEDDITDLPTRKGQYPLQKDLSHLRDRPAPADYQFHDLLQARNYLAKKELYL
ncbi:HAD family hydrolase [Enterococcus canis]|nr:HAD family phosphatase [Enterococcus canis]